MFCASGLRMVLSGSEENHVYYVCLKTLRAKAGVSEEEW